MKFSPGSFTKNFAWHGEGFLRLYDAIRNGFSHRIDAVSREKWRADCGEERADLQLVPLNFFLYQRRTSAGLIVCVDELVHQSLSGPHSLAYDRLALFAFHLSIAGDDAFRRNGQRGWAGWANEFVREELWSETGAWDADKLADSALLSGLRARITAQPQVLTKCFTNYRYFFGLAEYHANRPGVINTGYDDWIVPAIFLAWDRWQLLEPDRGSLSTESLAQVLSDLDVHKLIGAPEEVVISQADSAANAYLEVGGLDRFGVPASDSSIPRRTRSAAKPRKAGPRATKPQAALSPNQTKARLRALAQLQSDASVERKIREYQSQLRNRELASLIKQLYEDKCIFCESQLQVATNPDSFYVEAAHIRPLGKPHNGPDTAENLIPLCPNHHLQFDRGMHRIIHREDSFFIESTASGDPLHGRKLKIHEDHTLSDECVNYHFDWFNRQR